MSKFWVDRGIWDHPLFESKVLSRREAWLWMVSEAAWKSCESRGVGRGQFSHSIRFMADAWGWSKSGVLRFIRRLERANMVFSTRSKPAPLSGTGQIVITICNYDKYQAEISDSGTPSGTEAGQKRDKLNKEEDNKKEKKEDIAADAAPQLRLIEGSKGSSGGEPSSAAPYAFESGSIRLRQKDFDRWQVAYSNLDLRAELLSLEQWASQQKDWFFAVQGALAKRNRDMAVRFEEARRTAPQRPYHLDGII